jgi:RimJ/RimL family protein N-acetyltransferase
MEIKMLLVDIHDSLIALKNLEQHQLNEVLDWYNKSEEYKFATGQDGSVALELLMNKYLQTTDSDKDFFLGIFSICENKLVGVLKGKLAGTAIWITLIAIAFEYQGKKFGSMSINLLLDYMKYNRNTTNAYLAVVEKNIKGRKFWLKNGFTDIKMVGNHILFDNYKYNIIIMQKRL